VTPQTSSAREREWEWEWGVLDIISSGGFKSIRWIHWRQDAAQHFDPLGKSKRRWPQNNLAS
jgi:hypothetical protein